MSTRLIRPSHKQRLTIRCNVNDIALSNVAMHVVFFFRRHLDVESLAGAFEQALTVFPLFAGRMSLVDGATRIRCKGHGVPFTSVASGRTLEEAITSTSNDAGEWLVDPVNGATARWGLGPLCKVRVTHLADATTAIGFSWHHAIGDMQTATHFMNAWAAAAADKPPAEPLIVEDRAAYLNEHLPADGALEPGVRILGHAELVRSALYMAKDARKQRTLDLYFSEDEIARMRAAYGNRRRLSANDVVCAQVSEMLMKIDPAVDHRMLAIAVDARNRCGLDPMLAGNIVTALNLVVWQGESAPTIAERIRHNVDHFADEHCDMRINQQFLDAAGPWRAARCVAAGFNPIRWNPLITNWAGFGVYHVQFEGAFTAYCTPLMNLPVPGVGILVEGAGGRGLMFRMTLPPRDFEALCAHPIRGHLHRFRRAEDDTSLVRSEVSD